MTGQMRDRSQIARQHTRAKRPPPIFARKLDGLDLPQKATVGPACRSALPKVVGTVHCAVTELPCVCRRRGRGGRMSPNGARYESPGVERREASRSPGLQVRVRNKAPEGRAKRVASRRHHCNPVARPFRALFRHVLRQPGAALSFASPRAIIARPSGPFGVFSKWPSFLVAK